MYNVCAPFIFQNFQKQEPARTMPPLSENKWKLLGSRKTVEETFRSSQRINLLKGMLSQCHCAATLRRFFLDKKCVSVKSTIASEQAQIAFIYIKLALARF